jgi:hypothetical protein
MGRYFFVTSLFLFWAVVAVAMAVAVASAFLKRLIVRLTRPKPKSDAVERAVMLASAPDAVTQTYLHGQRIACPWCASRAAGPRFLLFVFRPQRMERKK